MVESSPSFDPHRPPVSIELQRAHERVAKLLRRLTVWDVRLRHEIGTIVHGIRASEACGPRALGVLARSLALNVTTLRRFAYVAEQWSQGEVHALLKEQGLVQISWSHLVALTPVRSRAIRVDLALAVIRDGLSVREVTIRAKALRATGARKAIVAPPFPSSNFTLDASYDRHGLARPAPKC